MQRIQSIDDPRAAPYRNLRDRTLRGESIFLAEGKLVTLRLLESRYAVESVLAADEHAGEMAALVGDRAPLYAAPAALVRQIVGFPFHRGVLALGRREGEASPGDLLAGADPAGPARLVVLPAVNQPENLGLIFRTAAGLGVDGVLLGRQCCDPLSRRSLRLSMGGALSVPFARSGRLAVDLAALKDRHGVALVAAVLDRAAEPLDSFVWPRRAAVLLGNEFEGLDAGLVRLCDFRVTIAMRPGADSLNVGVAAGIFLYEMTRQGPGRAVAGGPRDG